MEGERRTSNRLLEVRPRLGVRRFPFSCAESHAAVDSGGGAPRNTRRAASSLWMANHGPPVSRARNTNRFWLKAAVSRYRLMAYEKSPDQSRPRYVRPHPVQERCPQSHGFACSERAPKPRSGIATLGLGAPVLADPATRSKTERRTSKDGVQPDGNAAAEKTELTGVLSRPSRRAAGG
jgi:hypothetical protein